MRVIVSFLGLLIGLWISSCNTQVSNKVTIAAAANMQFALAEITDAYTHETGVVCETILGSSGKLSAQIKAGAPYQVFVSADMSFPNYLFESGLTDAKPKVYSNGTLVLWSFNGDINPSFETLEKGIIKHIAIPNPKTAPYGIAAMKVLKANGIFQKIENKLVYGESIGQTNQFITSGAAQVGITAKSVVMSAEMRNKGHWIEIQGELHDPISQGAVLIKGNDKISLESKQFFEFMFSDTAQSILEKYGYELP